MESQNKTPSKLRLSILSFYTFWSIWMMCSLINITTQYLESRYLNDNIFESIHPVTNGIGSVMLFGTINCFIIFYFSKLIEMFKNTNLSINPLPLNILLIIIILISIPAALPIALFLIICYIIIASVAALIAIILPMHRLYKFILFTTQNHSIMSSEINKTLLDSYTKTVNLIFLMEATFIATWIALWLQPINATLFYGSTLWSIVYFMGTFCPYFEFNHIAYKRCCKYTHKCWINLCQKIVGYEASKDQMLASLIQNDDGNDVIMELSVNDNTFCIDNVGMECPAIDRMCELLIKYSITNKLEQQSIPRILNDLDHLLQHHDNQQLFEQIYQKITEKHHCSAECVILKRNYRRRLGNHWKCISESDNDVMIMIMDKIHSFYYHSDVDDLRNITTDKQSVHAPTNKFNSLFEVEHDGNMYRFGHRFDYEESKSEWCITPRYNSLKEELLNNKICCITNSIYLIENSKAEQYMHTMYVRRLQQRNTDQIVSISHILALLIYCNCDEYQNKWSSTFRSIPNNEDNASLKKRHSYFYYSSLYLRDLVEYFGELLINNDNKTFYHGVSKMLYFTRSIAQFNGPLSTSEECQVALNFAGDQGVILELKYSFSTYPLKAKFFKCSFFSDYVNEKECLLIGGIPFMIITNIINVINGEEYGKYMNALNIINSILDGTYQPNDGNYNKDALQLCYELLSYQLNNATKKKYGSMNNKFPKYVETLLYKYCINLHHIMIFWHNMVSIQGFGDIFERNEDLSFFDLEMVLNLFPNIKQIEYFNESFNDDKVDRNRKIGNIIRYINMYKYNKKNELKYIVIHHEMQTLLELKDSDWILLQQQKDRTILSKDININNIQFRFNKINQGSTNKHLLSNLAIKR